MNQVIAYRSEFPDSISIRPLIEGRIALTPSFHSLSPLVQTELIRSMYENVTGILDCEFSYQMTQRLLTMTYDSGALSISVSPIWEVKRISQYLIFQRRSQDTLKTSKIHVTDGADINIIIEHPTYLEVFVELLLGSNSFPEDQKENNRNIFFPSQREIIIHNISNHEKLRIRNKKNGDVFHPSWKSREIKVVQFFREMNLPLHIRDNISLVTQGDQVKFV